MESIYPAVGQQNPRLCSYSVFSHFRCRGFVQHRSHESSPLEQNKNSQLESHSSINLGITHRFHHISRNHTWIPIHQQILESHIDSFIDLRITICVRASQQISNRHMAFTSQPLPKHRTRILVLKWFSISKTLTNPSLLKTNHSI